jgi:DNA polymerase-3 subunit alpha
MNINHALSVRSDFSLGDATLQIDKLIARAKELGYQSVALVDTMSISNMVAFTEKAKKAGIKPIVGCTVRVYDDPTYRDPKKAEREAGAVEKDNPFFWIKVYVRTEVGMQSVIRMLSKANSPEYFYYHSRVGLKEVLELKDVVISTGDFYSLFHHPKAGAILEQLASYFPGHVFAEVTPVATPLFRRLNAAALLNAEALELPLVATYPWMYDLNGAETADVMRAIATNAKMTDPWLSKPYVRDFHPMPPLALARAMKAEWPAYTVKALKGIDDLQALCTYQFKKLPPSLPTMAADEYMAVVEKCKVGFRERLVMGKVLGDKVDPAKYGQYAERLKYELGVIQKMNFSGYFLLVEDIVKWAKNSGIIVGPGRGSVGGSLVAYLMGITDVDPIRFNLLFERFINPERIDLPDADLDFMSRRRHEIIEYIVGKYGQDRVAGVSNYNALGAASSLRDVSRVHELPPFEYSCSKQVEKVHGVAQTLEESAVTVPEIEKFKNKYPTIWKHSVGLEGCLRGYGQHAAGIVVAGEPLANRAVVETRTGGPVVNWDKRFVEEWGLIKMDVLGLSTLDTLDLGRRYVEERTGEKIDYLSLPLNDPKVLEVFAKGETTGVFQFESAGMRRLLRELAMGGNLTFEDLVAVVALFRPGPLDAGLCEDYIQIKQGTKTPVYEHPNMAAVLKDTYGVIVYQEQVMEICRVLAGFTLAEADHVRKAMGKKDKDKMREWAERFVKGCATTSGMAEPVSKSLWDKIEVFAGYAFNRSHSVEYCVISWWTMWLKVYHPSAFYAASITVTNELSSDKSDDKIEALIIDAKKNGISVFPPDINYSSDRIEIRGPFECYAPFQAIKGVSEKTAAHIVAARNHLGKPVEHRSDFYAALDVLKIGGKVHSGIRERMEKIGVFAQAEKDPIGALHPTRLRDRLEFLPGYTVDLVKAERGINADRVALLKVIRIAEEARTCDKCSLKGNAHPMPRIGKTPKFMLVLDSPHYTEERAGRLLEGDNGALIAAALKDAGLSTHDGYFTTLVKSGKPKGQKQLTNEQINGCSEWLKAEIEVLKPPVIVAMGSNAIRFFAPEVKGGPAELAGKHAWDPKLDATIVFGLNPSMVFFDPSKIALVQATFKRVAELLS